MKALDLARTAMRWALVPIAIPFALVAKLFERPVVRSRGEVAALLTQAATGGLTDAAWDDFVCVLIADSALDEVRERCLRMAHAPSDQDVIAGYLFSASGRKMLLELSDRLAAGDG